MALTLCGMRSRPPGIASRMAAEHLQAKQNLVRTFATVLLVLLTGASPIVIFTRAVVSPRWPLPAASDSCLSQRPMPRHVRQRLPHFPRCGPLRNLHIAGYKPLGSVYGTAYLTSGHLCRQHHRTQQSSLPSSCRDCQDAGNSSRRLSHGTSASGAVWNLSHCCSGKALRRQSAVDAVDFLFGVFGGAPRSSFLVRFFLLAVHTLQKGARPRGYSGIIPSVSALESEAVESDQDLIDLYVRGQAASEPNVEPWHEKLTKRERFKGWFLGWNDRKDELSEKQQEVLIKRKQAVVAQKRLLLQQHERRKIMKKQREINIAEKVRQRQHEQRLDMQANESLESTEPPGFGDDTPDRQKQLPPTSSRVSIPKTQADNEKLPGLDATVDDSVPRKRRGLIRRGWKEVRLAVKNLLLFVPRQLYYFFTTPVEEAKHVLDPRRQANRAVQDARNVGNNIDNAVLNLIDGQGAEGRNSLAAAGKAVVRRMTGDPSVSWRANAHHPSTQQPQEAQADILKMQQMLQRVHNETAQETQGPTSSSSAALPKTEVIVLEEALEQDTPATDRVTPAEKKEADQPKPQRDVHEAACGTNCESANQDIAQATKTTTGLPLPTTDATSTNATTCYSVPVPHLLEARKETPPSNTIAELVEIPVVRGSAAVQEASEHGDEGLLNNSITPDRSGI
eukprot:GHVT01029338.1.p1 GENE.GHVT01029338.1~~GHVT01029338.1.p1  ORF type:complete len:677 (-),score=85.96 GHVT01029338.1:768-2798(-)